MSGTEDSVVIARGEISPENKRLVVAILGQFGLAAEIISPEEYRSLLPGQLNENESLIKPLDTLVRREDWVVKEHAREFRKNYTPQIAPKAAGHAFNSFIHTGSVPQGSRQSALGDVAEIDPFPGLKVIKRSDIDLPPYRSERQRSVLSDHCAQHAVELGSLVDARAALVQSSLERPGTQFLDFRAQFASHLALQLQER